MSKYQILVFFLAGFLLASPVGAETTIMSGSGDPGMELGPAVSLDTAAVEGFWRDRSSRIQTYLNERVETVTRALLLTDLPLRCSIHFNVSKDEKLDGIAEHADSADPEFDFICKAAIQSLEGNAVLKFPDGTHYKTKSTWVRFKYSGSLTNRPAGQLILSHHEIQSLMKLPIEQINNILRMSQEQVHQKLKSPNS